MKTVKRIVGKNSILKVTKELIFKRISYYTVMRTKSIKYKPRCATEDKIRGNTVVKHRDRQGMCLQQALDY